MDALRPKESLNILDAVAIVVGVVVGVGIFKTPSMVASVSKSGFMFILFWLGGGLVSLLGALCYCELTCAYPHAGGEYHFLKKAFGRVPAFLFAWSRMTVIQTGSIAMVAFLIGDYATELFNLGIGSSAIYALATVSLLTFINILGIKQGKRAQNILISLIVFGILAVISMGFFLTESVNGLCAGPLLPDKAALGTAMIFVLLTYGGWNEAAFISAEVDAKKQKMVKVLLYSITTITLIYVLINYALLRGLGLSAIAGSKTVVTDLMRVAIGDAGTKVITILILIAALSTVNATIITGARTNYALGRDFSFLKALGAWDDKRRTPVNGLVAQGVIATALVLLGAGSRDGFVTMIEYTAPVFWFFFLMVGLAVFVLRYRYPGTRLPFRVPLYPVIPLCFCLVCLFMLHASIAYTGRGAWVGIAVLGAGIPFLFLQSMKNRPNLVNFYI